LGEKPEKGAALMRYPLIRINVATCHIGWDSNNSPKRLFFCAAEVEFQNSRGHTVISISQKRRP
jgi:hypothetical protein